MSKSGVRKKKKKAFTLIELMIVVAVIGILAIVLIPKAGAARTEAKVVGVSANVNAVRSFLELRTGARFIDSVENLEDAINGTFTGNEVLKNPLDEEGEAVVVVDDPEDMAEVAGSVVVIIGESQYELYGVDNTGSKIGNSVIIKK